MSKSKIRLGINIDHIATIKTNRKTPYPSLIDAVKIVEDSGADLITVHLREDRRHIQDQDLRDIKLVASTLNLEMALTDEMVNICLSTKPNYCCIVPERREELTTEGGLDIKGMTSDKFSFLKDSIKRMHSNNIKVSLFIDPDIDQIVYCLKSGATCIELHTGSYADSVDLKQKEKELDRIKIAAEYASKNNIQVHAGHGLNLSNLQKICRISQIEELNIGHSVVADSIFKGLKKAVQDFRKAIDHD
tara:strand:+ start:790 stop:1530 length:741 start_codon:yes stop_codon:yes gene_type:complete